MKAVVSKLWDLPIHNGRRYSDPGNIPSEPPLGDAGWEFNGSDNIATATDITIDLRVDHTGSTILWVDTGPQPSGEPMLRAPTAVHAPSDGFWGSGCYIFTPGSWEIDPDRGNGQHVCGLGALNGFDSIVGGTGCRQLVVGQLMMYGSTYLTAVTPESCKDVILYREEGPPDGGRPMLIPKIYGAGGNVAMAACDDEVCNATDDPDDDNFFNDPPNPFDFRDYYGQWVWIELQVDMDLNQIRVKIWTADGVHNGTLYTMQDMGGDILGSVPGLNVIGFLNSAPVLDENCFKKITMAQLQLGSATDMTPPLGFPGSMR